MKPTHSQIGAIYAKFRRCSDRNNAIADTVEHFVRSWVYVSEITDMWGDLSMEIYLKNRVDCSSLFFTKTKKETIPDFLERVLDKIWIEADKLQ